MKKYCIVLLAAVVLAIAAPGKVSATGGAKAFVIGQTTAAAAIVVSAGLRTTFYGVKYSSGIVGDFVKCFSTASINGVSLSREADLLFSLVISTGGSEQPTVPTDPAFNMPPGIVAPLGVSCIKSNARGTAIIYYIE